MSVTLKPYPEYKDSGLPWLGEIPRHWEVRRNGRLFAQRNQTDFANLPILEVSLRTGVRVRDFENSTRKQIMADRDKYKRAAKGDIAYNMMRLWQGAVGIAPVEGLVSPAYVVARPFPETETRYFNYLFRTNVYMHEVDKHSRGIVKDRNRLYWDEFKQMPSAFPQTNEQKAIADFLDVNARMTRRLIRAKRWLIELLNEQKQAIIHRAVTRGLDPNVPLKPSGVDWLGDVPEHWGVKRLKQVCRLAYGDSLPDESRILETVPVYGSNGQVGSHNRANTEGPCLIIGRKGSFGKVNFSPISVFAIDTTFFIDRRSTDSHLRWLFYILTWSRLDSVSKDAAVPGLDRVEVYSQVVPYCPRPEQEQIAAWLDARLHEVDLAIGKANRETDLLREYRTRLITDVVTGKLDVRGMDLPALDETEALDNLDIDEDAEVENIGEMEEADA